MVITAGAQLPPLITLRSRYYRRSGTRSRYMVAILCFVVRSLHVVPLKNCAHSTNYQALPSHHCDLLDLRIRIVSELGAIYKS